MNHSLFLVEDEPFLRGLLKTLLELDGFQVRAFEGFDQEEFLAEIKSLHPDAIIMDVHIKHVNTIDMISLIQSLPMEKPPKIIMTSGMDLKQQCITAGADMYLQKPFMPDELLGWMKNNLSYQAAQE